VDVCVCIRTYTHTTRRVFGCEPRCPIGTRHLESPKNPDRVNLRIHVDTCEVHMYVYTHVVRWDEFLD